MSRGLCEEYRSNIIKKCLAQCLAYSVLKKQSVIMLLLFIHHYRCSVFILCCSGSRGLREMEKLVVGVGAGRQLQGGCGADAGVLGRKGVLDVESRGGRHKESGGHGSE